MLIKTRYKGPTNVIRGKVTADVKPATITARCNGWSLTAISAELPGVGLDDVHLRIARLLAAAMGQDAESLMRQSVSPDLNQTFRITRIKAEL